MSRFAFFSILMVFSAIGLISVKVQSNDEFSNPGGLSLIDQSFNAYRNKEYLKSYGLLRDAQSQNPRSPTVQRNLGWLILHHKVTSGDDEKRYRKAIAHFKKAEILFERGTVAWRSFGSDNQRQMATAYGRLADLSDDPGERFINRQEALRRLETARIIETQSASPDLAQIDRDIETTQAKFEEDRRALGQAMATQRLDAFNQRRPLQACQRCVCHLDGFDGNGLLDDYESILAELDGGPLPEDECSEPAPLINLLPHIEETVRDLNETLEREDSRPSIERLEAMEALIREAVMALEIHAKNGSIYGEDYPRVARNFFDLQKLLADIAIKKAETYARAGDFEAESQILQRANLETLTPLQNDIETLVLGMDRPFSFDRRYPNLSELFRFGLETEFQGPLTSEPATNMEDLKQKVANNHNRILGSDLESPEALTDVAIGTQLRFRPSQSQAFETQGQILPGTLRSVEVETSEEYNTYAAGLMPRLFEISSQVKRMREYSCGESDNDFESVTELLSDADGNFQDDPNEELTQEELDELRDALDYLIGTQSTGQRPDRIIAQAPAASVSQDELLKDLIEEQVEEELEEADKEEKEDIPEELTRGEMIEQIRGLISKGEFEVKRKHRKDYVQALLDILSEKLDDFEDRQLDSLLEYLRNQEVEVDTLLEYLSEIGVSAENILQETNADITADGEVELSLRGKDQKPFIRADLLDASTEIPLEELAVDIKDNILPKIDAQTEAERNDTWESIENILKEIGIETTFVGDSEKTKEAIEEFLKEDEEGETQSSGQDFVFENRDDFKLLADNTEKDDQFSVADQTGQVQGGQEGALALYSPKNLFNFPTITFHRTGRYKNERDPEGAPISPEPTIPGDQNSKIFVLMGPDTRRGVLKLPAGAIPIKVTADGVDITDRVVFDPRTSLYSAPEVKSSREIRIEAFRSGRPSRSAVRDADADIRRYYVEQHPNIDLEYPESLRVVVDTWKDRLENDYATPRPTLERQAANAIRSWIYSNIYYTGDPKTEKLFEDFVERAKKDPELNVPQFSLECKKGNCITHNALFATIVREEFEIPTRMRSGWMGKEGVISSLSGHRWAEAWIEGEGWVEFDSTSSKREYTPGPRRPLPSLPPDVPPGVQTRLAMQRCLLSYVDFEIRERNDLTVLDELMTVPKLRTVMEEHCPEVSISQDDIEDFDGKLFETLRANVRVLMADGLDPVLIESALVTTVLNGFVSGARLDNAPSTEYLEWAKGRILSSAQLGDLVPLLLQSFEALTVSGISASDFYEFRADLYGPRENGFFNIGTEERVEYYPGVMQARLEHLQDHYRKGTPFSAAQIEVDVRANKLVLNDHFTYPFENLTPEEQAVREEVNETALQIHSLMLEVTRSQVRAGVFGEEDVREIYSGPTIPFATYAVLHEDDRFGQGQLENIPQPDSYRRWPEESPQYARIQALWSDVFLDEAIRQAKETGGFEYNGILENLPPEDLYQYFSAMLESSISTPIVRFKFIDGSVPSTRDAMNFEGLSAALSPVLKKLRTADLVALIEKAKDHEANTGQFTGLPNIFAAEVLTRSRVSSEDRLAALEAYTANQPFRSSLVPYRSEHADPRVYYQHESGGTHRQAVIAEFVNAVDARSEAWSTWSFRVDPAEFQTDRYAYLRRQRPELMTDPYDPVDPYDRSSVRDPYAARDPYSVGGFGGGFGGGIAAGFSLDFGQNIQTGPTPQPSATSSWIPDVSVTPAPFWSPGVAYKSTEFGEWITHHFWGDRYRDYTPLDYKLWARVPEGDEPSISDEAVAIYRRSREEIADFAKIDDFAGGVQNRFDENALVIATLTELPEEEFEQAYQAVFGSERRSDFFRSPLQAFATALSSTGDERLRQKIPDALYRYTSSDYNICFRPDECAPHEQLSEAVLYMQLMLETPPELYKDYDSTVATRNFGDPNQVEEHIFEKITPIVLSLEPMAALEFVDDATPMVNQLYDYYQNNPDASHDGFDENALMFLEQLQEITNFYDGAFDYNLLRRTNVLIETIRERLGNPIDYNRTSIQAAGALKLAKREIVVAGGVGAATIESWRSGTREAHARLTAETSIVSTFPDDFSYRFRESLLDISEMLGEQSPEATREEVRSVFSEPYFEDVLLRIPVKEKFELLVDVLDRLYVQGNTLEQNEFLKDLIRKMIFSLHPKLRQTAMKIVWTRTAKMKNGNYHGFALDLGLDYKIFPYLPHGETSEGDPRLVQAILFSLADVVASGTIREERSGSLERFLADAGLGLDSEESQGFSGMFARLTRGEVGREIVDSELRDLFVSPELGIMTLERMSGRRYRDGPFISHSKPRLTEAQKMSVLASAVNAGVLNPRAIPMVVDHSSVPVDLFEDAKGKRLRSNLLVGVALSSMHEANNRTHRDVLTGDIVRYEAPYEIFHRPQQEKIDYILDELPPIEPDMVEMLNTTFWGRSLNLRPYTSRYQPADYLDQ